jgi:Protein of unknown function (DUF2959)
MRRENAMVGLCLVVLCAISLPGCESVVGYHRADIAVGHMNALKTELLGVKDQIAKTVPALNQVVETASSDPRPAYETFRREFENTKRQSGRVRRRADEVKRQGQAYFQAWEAQFDKVANPETRQRFEQRKTELAAQYEKIEEFAQRVEADYNAFMQDLNDIHLVLGVDLTAKGIASIADLVTKATQDAKTIDDYLDTYVTILDQTMAELRPSQQ